MTQPKANLLIAPTCVASARLTRNATTSAVKAMAGLYCRSRGYSSTRHAEIVSKAPDTVARQERTTRLKGQGCNNSSRWKWIYRRIRVATREVHATYTSYLIRCDSPKEETRPEPVVFEGGKSGLGEGVADQPESPPSDGDEQEGAVGVLRKEVRWLAVSAASN